MLSLVLGAASLCSAATITYGVSQTVGPGSLTGFIETDGTFGAIGTGNIVDSNLLLNDGRTTLDDNLSNSVFEVPGGGALSATTTQLLFNFDQHSLPIFEDFQGDTDQVTYLSGTQVIAGASHDDEHDGPDNDHDPEHNDDNVQANADAPEPSTLGLLVAGIALLWFCKFQ